jgi:translation initiation factor IF-1
MANYFNRNKNLNKQQQRRPKVHADNSQIQESKDGYVIVEGRVNAIQTGSRFQVDVEIGEKKFIVNAHLCGKLKMHKIRIVQYDIVILEVMLADLMSGNDTLNGRIKQRKDALRVDVTDGTTTNA